MANARARLASLATVLLGFFLPGCGGPSDANSGGDGGCEPDNDGIIGVAATEYLVVNDTGFFFGGPDAGARTDIQTQNVSPITLTLQNTGTKPHGFEVECTSVLPVYPNVPAGCPTTACFPASSTIAPIAPGTSVTVSFVTPYPDNLSYPFRSSAPDDATVPGLNGSVGTAWILN
jgi:hypothetical protein